MDYDFVEDLSEEFTCQVCMKLLNEPQLTDCCGQHFCRACLDRWFQQKCKKLCPHCRSEGLAHMLNKSLQHKIKEVKVYCPKRKEGCKETMKIEELERHLSKENTNGCGYVTVKCMNEDCDKGCLRKDLDNHTRYTCEYREVKCQYYGEVGQYWDITSEGHTRFCPEYPVGCPNKCDTVKDLRRKDLKAHRGVCPREPVECPFSEAGCKEQLVRKDLDSHIQTNTQQHLLILKNSHKKLLSKHTTLMTLHNSLQKRHDELKSTVAGITTELEALNPRVTDRDAVANSLERITEALSLVSLRLLEEENDQLEFKFPNSLKSWTSPMFHVSKIKMIIVYSQENRKLSLVCVSGKLDGKYEVRVNVNSVDNIKGKKSFCSIMTGDLCSRCTKLSELKKNSSTESGVEITQCSIPYVLLPYPTCVVTVTLYEHNCYARHQDSDSVRAVKK